MDWIAMIASRWVVRQAVMAAIGIVFFALTTATGIDVGRRLLRPADASPIDSRKQQLALVGEVELGHAVQEFKDCILRSDPSYCNGFYEHIQAVDRAVSLYSAQDALGPDEKQTLGTLRQALSVYRSAIYEVRAMQSRHATIEEIDAAVKGEDRPIAAELHELANLSAGSGSSFFSVPTGQAFLLAAYACLAGLFAYLAFRSRGSLGETSAATAQSLRQLSNRMIEWEERKKAKAFARLHDGVCQSLSGIMYFLKSREHSAGDSGQPSSADPAEPLIPSLQAAIQDARAVALALRPPKLLESGLLTTLNSLWIDAKVLNPSLVIEAHSVLEERDVPNRLKPVILRIAQMMLGFAELESLARRIAWILERDGSILRLTIETAADGESAVEGDSDAQSLSPADKNPSTLDLLDAIRARVEISGGRSNRLRDASGDPRLVASWRADDSAAH
jgi:hypothetical protein